MYTLGSGGGVRIVGVQVSDYSVCMSRCWRGGGTALCAVEGWDGGCCGGVENIFLLAYCVVHSLYRSSTRGPEDDSVVETCSPIITLYV